MRRALTLTSLGLVFLGLELSTEALSTTVARLVTGLGALMSGTEYFVPAAVFAAGFGFLLVGMMLGGLLVWAGRERVRVETVGRTCPDCGGATHRLRRRFHHKLISQLVREPLSYRRCGDCGWSGLSLKA